MEPSLLFTERTMPFVPLHQFCPDLAERETRVIHVMPDGPVDSDLPAGAYQFSELYCNEKGCDCRRVLFNVYSVERRRLEACIGWGWESVEFYDRWMNIDDLDLANEMKGPALNLASPQSEYASELLDLTARVLLQDPSYVERLNRHYAEFRAKIDDKQLDGKSPRERAEERRRRRLKQKQRR
jgi:hypothetical protein